MVQLRVLRIDLRNDQRHVGIETEGGGIVHEYRARLDDGGGKLPRDVVFGRAEHDVHALKGALAGLLDAHGLLLPRKHLARAAAARQQMQLRNGEVPLGQNAHHLAPDRAGRAQNGYFVSFHKGQLLYFTNASYRTRMVAA